MSKLFLWFGDPQFAVQTIEDKGFCAKRDGCCKCLIKTPRVPWCLYCIRALLAKRLVLLFCLWGGEQVLASVSHDKSIRFWDLHTRHEIDVVERAHDTPIHHMEYCEKNEEIATAASEPIVKIWCALKHSLKLVLTPHLADVTQVGLHLLKCFLPGIPKNQGCRSSL